MKLSFVVVCMLGACIARADVYYDFETAATSPVWLGTTQIIQNTSASHQGTNAIAFAGGPQGAYVLTELPQGTTNVEFYIHDDYGPNPPLYQYMYFRLLEATNSTGFAGFSMLDGGWGTNPPATMNHYYAWGHEDYNAANMGPIRTIGWHKFTFAVGADSVALSVDDTLVFQTNMIRVARYFNVAFGQDGGWGRMDDLSVSTGTWPPLLCVTPPPGLVSWWQAEGNANDTVDGNSGALLNGATFAPGRVGQAFSFDGTNDHIRIPNAPNLRFTNGLTVEAWLYPISHGAYHEIVCKWDTNRDYAQKSWTTTVGPGGQAAIAVCADGYDWVRAAVGSTNSLPLNQWTHFAGTYDGAALRVYINGICENQVAYNQGIFPGTNDLGIGGWVVGNVGEFGSPFAGRIDEPAIYNRALSPAEIQAIYNAGSAGKCKEPLFTGVTIYSNDFENPVGAEWSTNHRILTPGGTRPQTAFLGGNINGRNFGFANDTVTLSLNNLAPHSWVEVTFDLYIINSWDCLGPSGPDYFTLAVQGGPVLLQTTFDNIGFPQSYPADVGGGSYPSRTGALEVGSLGMGLPAYGGDCVYRITRRVQSSASSIQFQFIGGVNEPDGYTETWGLDNVIVSAGAYPPVIVSQPTNQFVLAGSNMVLTVSVTGTQPLSYQWALNERSLSGETNYTLSLPDVSGLNAGFYTVVVTNVTGSVTSTPALLDVRYSLAYGNGERMLGSNYTFIGSVGLQLWSVFANGNIFYTLDGSEPTFGSSYYAGPFNVNRSATLRVIAYSADYLQAAEAPPIYLTVIPTYALNLTSPGGGTVTVDPAGGPYVSNSIVTLTPQPSNGWTFLEWRGDASGTSPTVDLTMNRAKTVQAIFGTTLGTTVAGNGTVNMYPALPLYPYGTVARLTAIPQAGSYFAVWGNAASGSTNPLYFTVTNATPAVSSLFAALGTNQYALTVIPAGFGKVAITPRANVYATGANVALNAIPDPGQQFLTWSGDAVGTQNPLTISMNTSKTITATFTRKPSLTVASPLGGLFENGFRLTLTGEFGGAYEVFGSTNLLDWIQAGTVTNVYGTSQFTDSAATNVSARFYRALSLGQ